MYRVVDQIEGSMSDVCDKDLDTKDRNNTMKKDNDRDTQAFASEIKLETISIFL